MTRTHTGETMAFLPVSGGRWAATMQTPDGPVTAVGDDIGEAQAAIDALRTITRAVEVTREHDGE